MHAFQASQLLRLLARLHPELWEVAHPHVPIIGGRSRVTATDPFSAVELNPQPLPPREALRVAVQLTASSVADAAIAAHIAGHDVGEILQEVGEDWCLTRPGRRIPWPRHWPHPWPPGEPYPIDPAFVTHAVIAEAALVFQSYASGIADQRLSAAFGHLANRMMDAALDTQQHLTEDTAAAD